MLGWLLIFFCSNSFATQFVSIRGPIPSHSIPTNLLTYWDVWSYDLKSKNFNQVELPSTESTQSVSISTDWVHPTSFNHLYLPADLPMPTASAALGVVLANGIPRYIMPSIILSLSTPSKNWRNRGLCSLPRAKVWIDLFSPNSPNIKSLKMSAFGRDIQNLKFLEDQDGSGVWRNLFEMLQVALRPQDDAIEIHQVFESFKKGLHDHHDRFNAAGLMEGYHFVDVMIPSTTDPIRLPQLCMKMYLTDMSEPRRFLELEDSSVLDNEPLGLLDIDIKPIGAGRDSKFLPQVYTDLFEEGNIVSDS